MLAHSDLMRAVDRFQAHSPEAVLCDRDPKHGKLTMSGSLRSIVCGVCGLNYPLSSEYVAAVVAFGK
jgi:hypothetical protein